MVSYVRNRLLLVKAIVQIAVAKAKLRISTLRTGSGQSGEG